ncbi:uncharacterized protein J8A68_004983 [[Candida] subhashii]|uniref:G1/S-specific cyclin n=1 Tax=[Candida] subhashii TaxID=561895 RepID=A0A8J5QG81_9ASCO|nr:uncharacterized protein J8A68_004983 [[Candida] subhashii]KAG7661524.1 hypothetical protein J8A68_004983 [[Candida] subhashii]
MNHQHSQQQPPQPPLPHFNKLQQPHQHKPIKYGPPSNIKPRSYNVVLELLESQANKKLTEEYSTEYTDTLAALEPLAMINPAMIDLQPEIQWFMRPFLLDFIIELHSSFKLQPQTLFLCLNIIDRYCAKRIVFKRHYQLVGCTAFWIAGKYEDKKSRVPTLKELTTMCRNAYDEEMFIQMEMHILSTLEWSLSHPNLEECLQLAIKHSKVVSSDVTPCKYNIHKTGTLSAVIAVGRFLCELSLYDRFFLTVPTSLVAITANLLACSMLQIPEASIALKQLVAKVLGPLKKSESQNRNMNNGYFSYYADNDDDSTIDESEEEDDSYFEEFDDEDIENVHPQIHGPFLSGLDKDSLLTIKKIAIMLILQLNKVTEVLVKKYDVLGVIQVINNFHTRNSFFIQQLQQHTSISELPESFNPDMIHIAEILLQLSSDQDSDDENDEFDPASPYIFQQSTLAPQTPPSATSQYSVFSKRSVSGGSSNSSTPTYSIPNSQGITKMRICKKRDFSPMKSYCSPIQR